jgi:peptide/nickel transport system substrate-binding protein
MDFIAKPDMKHAQQLLKQTRYDGKPVILLHATDLTVMAKLAPVAAQLLRQAGFAVEMQSMDWQTMVARLAQKDAPSQGGWNVHVVVSGLFDCADPIANVGLNAACDKAPVGVGWPCDGELEKLRDDYARAMTDPDRKTIAEQVQMRAMEVGTYVPLGELRYPAAVRKNVKGLLSGYFLAAWNVEVE